MVEKITINPTKVRAYGNIINQHSTTDYTNYACTLTEETDTINGQTVPVYEMEDTILFWDKAITGMKNTAWGNVGNRIIVTTNDSGTTLGNTSSGNGYYNANCTFSNAIIEFDIINHANGVRLYVEDSGNGQDLLNLQTYNITNGHIKVLINNSVAKVYHNGTQKGNDISITVGSTLKFVFRLLSGTPSKTITYKNFIIYEG